MKGKWIFALIGRVLDKSISLRDAFAFIQWRLVPKSSISMNGLIFSDADHITWSLLTETFLHREYTSYGFEIAPNDIVVDIGAHRGIFVGYAAKKTKSQIIAIEPDTANFESLNKFVYDNHLTNVRTQNYAIGASDGMVKMYLSESSRHSITGFDQGTGKSLGEYVEIPSVSLDTLLSTIDRIDFLKIDCEGAEYEILAKVSASTLGKIKKISMEIHNLGNEPSVENLLLKLHNSFNVVVFRQKSKTIGIVNAMKS